MCLKNANLVFFYSLKHLKPIFLTFSRKWLFIQDPLLLKFSLCSGEVHVSAIVTL